MIIDISPMAIGSGIAVETQLAVETRPRIYANGKTADQPREVLQ